jgi:CheY-like chemotaxis protein
MRLRGRAPPSWISEPTAGSQQSLAGLGSGPTFLYSSGPPMAHSGLHLLRPGETVGAAVADARPSPPRLLIVEDDTAIRESLAEALHEDGFEVAAAANGRQALEILRRGPRCSAILLDVMMPVMDGWDFRYEQLNDAMLRDIPVVIVTASGFSAGTLRMQFGDVELIRKPVDYSELLGALARACGSTANAA